MSLADVEQVALKLTESDRARLASILIDSIATDFVDRGSEEIDRREREMDEGAVAEISHEELFKRVAMERGR